MYDNTEHSEKELVAVGENLVTLPKELNLDMALHGFSGKKLLTLDAVYSDHHEEIVYTIHSKGFTVSPQLAYTSYLDFNKFTTDYSKRHGFVHYEIEPVYIKGAMIKSLLSSLSPRVSRYFAELQIPSECWIEFSTDTGCSLLRPP